jgi:sec-independent protein translocase protein TatA
MSIWHWLIVAGLAIVLFGGAGRLSSLMGDAAKGVRAFRDGLKSDGTEDAAPAEAAQTPPAAPAPQPLPQPAPTAQQGEIVR